MKYVKFEKRIISWVSLLFTIIMVIVIAIALFRASGNVLNAADNNDIQNANPQTTATGPVTQDFTTHPVDEQYLEQLAVQFNNQNTGSKNTAIVPQSSTNQDVVLLGINGELGNPPTAQTPINNVTAPGESSNDATSNSDGGSSNSNSNSNKNPITEIINDILHPGNSNSSTNNSNNSNSTTNNSGNTPAESTNSNSSNGGTNSTNINNSNSGSNIPNGNSGNSNTNSNGTAPTGNNPTGVNNSNDVPGATTNNNSIPNKIKQMENMLKNNRIKSATN